MKQPLKILHLEDLQSDADLVARTLQRSGLHHILSRAENKEEFLRELLQFSPDIILSDHSLPSFDSHEALTLTRSLGFEIPFLLITATVSEEYAVSIIKGGACDYILKDRLQRLPSAVTSAIEKYRLQKEQQHADEKIRASQRKYKLLFEGNPLPMWMLSKPSLQIIAVNEAAISHYGYSRDEFLALTAKELRPAEDVQDYLLHLSTTSTASRQGIWRHRKKDGTIIMVDVIAHDLVYENNPVRLVLVNDVTDKLRIEAEIAEERLVREKLITETSIRVQEKERDMIGKELHDNINQILATAKMYTDIALSKNGTGGDALQKAQENILFAITEIRKLSHSLVAPSLHTTSLSQAIEELFDDIRTGSQLELEFMKPNFDDCQLEQDISLMFYRIMQEQVNNVLKYAGAKRLCIELRIEADIVILRVSDDGKGFDTRKISGGIGLRNVRNRVEFYDGAMEIKSRPGEGCILEVMVPLRIALKNPTLSAPSR